MIRRKPYTNVKKYYFFESFSYSIKIMIFNTTLEWVSITKRNRTWPNVYDFQTLYDGFTIRQNLSPSWVKDFVDCFLYLLFLVPVHFNRTFTRIISRSNTQVNRASRHINSHKRDISNPSDSHSSGFWSRNSKITPYLELSLPTPT